MKKVNTQIFKTPYTISRINKSFDAVPTHTMKFTRWVDQHQKKGNWLLTGGLSTGSQKTMAVATIGEYFGTIPGTRYTITLQRGIKTQIENDIVDLQKQGWAKHDYQFSAVARIHNIIKKINDNLELKEEEKEIKTLLYNTAILFIDEAHQILKGIESKMIDEILQHLLSQGRLKIVIALTATYKYLEKWFALQRQYNPGSPDIGKCLYNLTFVYDKSQNVKDGYTKFTDLKVVKVNSQIDIHIGDFDQMYDWQSKTKKELESDAKNLKTHSIIKKDPNSARTAIKANDVKLSNNIFNDIRKIILERIKALASCHKLSGKNVNGLYYVPLKEDGDNALEYLSKDPFFKTHNIEFVAWYTDSTEWKLNKGSWENLIKRFENPADPLKIIIFVGTGRVGLDTYPSGKSEFNIYNARYYKGSPDIFEQIDGRPRDGGSHYIAIDCLNAVKPSQEMIDFLQEHANELFDEEFIAMAAAAQAADSSTRTGNRQGSYEHNPNNFQDCDPGVLDPAQGVPKILGWIRNITNTTHNVVSIDDCKYRRIANGQEHFTKKQFDNIIAEMIYA